MTGPFDSLNDVGPPGAASPQLVRARDTLLRALHGLAPHLDSLTLIGAQAVYEHTKQYTDAAPTFTNDGDLSVDPTLVSAEPDIAVVMTEMGFTPKFGDRPGIWTLPITAADPDPPSIDLLVPDAVAGPGRRSVQLAAGHGKHAVGRAAGLEMALLDRAPVLLTPLPGGTGEPVTVHIAGPAALLCAKSYKIAERVAAARRGSSHRVKAKDAGDVYRLLATSDPAATAAVFDRCARHETLGASATLGRDHFTALFEDAGIGVDLAVEDLADDLADTTVRPTISDWIHRFQRN